MSDQEKVPKKRGRKPAAKKVIVADDLPENGLDLGPVSIPCEPVITAKNVIKRVYPKDKDIKPNEPELMPVNVYFQLTRGWHDRDLRGIKWHTDPFANEIVPEGVKRFKAVVYLPKFGGSADFDFTAICDVKEIRPQQ